VGITLLETTCLEIPCPQSFVLLMQNVEKKQLSFSQSKFVSINVKSLCAWQKIWNSCPLEDFE